MPEPNDSIEYTLWLGGQALNGLFYIWPITLALLCATRVTGLWQLRRFRFPGRLLYLLVPFVFPLLSLIWGAVMQVPPGSSPPSWPQTVLLFLFGAHLLAGIGSALVIVGARWFSASMVTLSLWYGLWCAFVAGS